ncbi:MAG: DUF3500 domain-containing protein [Burkholderiales bacterium]
MKFPGTVAVVGVLFATAVAAATINEFRAPAGQRDVPASYWEEPYVGITAGGRVAPGLFKLAQTGVSTVPLQQAAAAFLASLDDAQRKKSLFPVTDDEWRRWDNRHFPTRQGMGFFEMNVVQRALAIEMMRAGLSARGLKQTRDVMNLNGTLAELTGNYGEYGKWFYWITIMGEPSATQPWGWQLDGHHAIINYFVLGDQVVMTPVFMGSEPVKADSGRFKGTEILQAEQDRGLALMRALTAAQQSAARIRIDKSGSDLLADAYKDNLVLDYAGIRATALNAAQQAQLLGLIAEYVDNMKEGHAKVKMAEVRKHLDNTYFGWIGGTTPDAVFYYRIHSPVILIEFDHQRPIALERTGKPTRNHIHTVVRTPNGNDYGMDLLRQHHLKHKH